jgi:hypothetical protein
VILPSNCSTADVSVEHLAWATTELRLRVGIGHGFLADLRNAAAMHSYYLRRQSSSRGLSEMKTVARCQDSASKKKSKHISLYIDNWKCMQKIFSIFPQLQERKGRLLKGLQPLNRKEDVNFFEGWGERINEYGFTSDLRVSWIWRVAMEDQSELVTSQNELDWRLSTWESEGKGCKFTSLN